MDNTEVFKYIEDNYFRKTNKELSIALNMSEKELLNFVEENNIDISKQAKKRYKLNYVKGNYGLIPHKEIEDFLGIGRKRLNELAKELDIFVDPHVYSNLTEEEKIEYIRTNINKKTRKDIIAYLHISGRKFDTLVEKEKIEYNPTKKKNIAPTDEVLETIKKKYKLLGEKKLAAELHCSTTFVSDYAKKLGLTKARSIWSNEEDSILMDYYEELSLERLQIRLKGNGYIRTIKAIKERLKKLHIHLLEYGMFLTTKDIKELMGFSLEKIAYLYKSHLENESFNGFRRCTIDAFETFLKDHPNLWNARTADIESLKILFVKSSSSNYNSDKNNYSLYWLTEKVVQDYSTEKIERREWTTLEEKKYIQFREEGKTINEIKPYLNRTYSSLQSKTRHVNLRSLKGGDNNAYNA